MSVPTIAILLVTLSLAEIALRIAYGRIEAITGVVPWRVEDDHWDQYHSIYGWTNAPGYRSDSRVPFRVTINSQGLRATRDYGLAPPPRVRRVALFGDSGAFGEEVDDDQTVSVHLERQLPHSETLNFGVRGYGLGQMVLRLEEEAFALHPHHVVILLFIPQDVFRDGLAEFVHPKPAFKLEGSRLTLRNTPVPDASRQPWLFRHSFAAAWLLDRPQESWTPGRVNLGELLDVTRLLLQRAKGACARHDVRLTVVSTTFAQVLDSMDARPRTRAWIDGMRDALREMRDIDVLDVFDVQRRVYAAEGQALVMRRGHWSGRGNELLAAEIARHLAATDPSWSRGPDD